MQQGGGGGGSGSQSQYGEMSGGGGSGGPASTGLASTHMVDQSQQQLVEAASPISSRPPASGNLDEFIRLSGGGDEDALGAVGEEGDRAGASSSNRWPRQETLALLKIRSDMDAAFRDATVKGPLWEDVSRKLAELGYKRSAKKCKEKFENVHKYYKRTKEGRAGRQDGKSYKFFSELEALHSSSAAAAVTHAANVSMSVTPATAGTTLDVAPVSVGIPMQVSSTRIPPNPSQPVSTVPMSSSIFTMPAQAPGSAPSSLVPPVYTSATAPFGISFSSDSSSSSSERSEDDDDDEEELGGEPSTAAGGSRKRKRQSSRVRSGSGNTRRMMQFFEGLMKQVMQKQEAMQQRFLEAIEKREQDRMIREEAWKRQEMVRLAREHELMAQERAVAANRDAAIVSFLQKITGQTIQLPTTVTIPTVTVTAPPTQPAQVITPGAPISTAAAPQHQPPVRPQQTPPPPPPPQVQQQHLHHQHQQQHRSQSSDVVRHQAPISSEVVMAIPEQTVPPQDIGGGGSSEPTSSRWPKPEVLALIKLRSGLESRYQEAGPKGPLWEEISAGMLQMGYKRSAKRCKEKWENINKYFKKVKESNKKRPEDAKTCPYFQELDALYRKKILGSGGGASSSSFTGQQRSEEQTSEQHQQESVQVAQAPATMAAPQPTQAGESENKSGAGGDVQAGKEGIPGSLFGEGNGATKKPEDIMRELMEQQGIPQQQHQQPGQPLAVEDYEKTGDPDSDVMDEGEDENGEDEDELEEARKMSYKIEFQRQNTGPSNGGGNGTPSFLTMVQ